MATVLDVSLLKVFDPIFAVLFVFAVLFAILQKTKALTDNVSINSLIAVVVSFMVLLSTSLVKMINFMIPWFVVVFIFLILLLLVFQIFGAKEADFAGAIKDKALMWTLIGVGLVIFAASFSTIVPEDVGPYLGSGDATTVTTTTDGGSVSGGLFSSNLMATLFHPKVIGLIIIFLVAVFAVGFLSGNA
ncbi:hypothetical protein COY27_02220 [Candidatus Woesearchaeota archaeon CG_4_10_14_0_2_um_filter_33_13]|nr:MAG: hypothetical protein COY27_02220 [Candidatus Woesearchaeota archaeon CG_4_10_14_0_2_um_filter_33_13]